MAEENEAPGDLDAEFKKILCIIKPYIPYIADKRFIHFYRIWLERLSRIDTSEKQLRNAYLKELSRQIQAAVLEPPFTAPPPVGQLPPLKTKDSSEETLNTETSNEQNVSSIEMPVPHQVYSYPVQIPHVFPSELPEKLNPQQSFDDKAVIEKFKNFNDTEPESSWCDASEISTPSATAYASGDSSKNELNQLMRGAAKSMLADQMKVGKMVNLIRKLQKENRQIYERVLEEGNDVYSKVLAQRHVKVPGSDSDSCDTEFIKRQLEELQGIKHTLEMEGLQGPDTLETLKLELRATKAKNAELQSALVILEDKLKEYELQKHKETTSLKKKLTETYQREIEMLKELHSQEIMKLANSYKQNCAEFQHSHKKQLDQVKLSYENEIMALKGSYEKILQKKEEQIRLLEETVQKQCAKMEEEVKYIQDHLKRGTAGTSNKGYSEKVTALQNCVAKMEKLFKKAEKEYQKQINKLKKKIKLCNKANELLMQSDKLHTVVDNNEVIQQKVDSLIGDLENYYKNLLDTTVEQTLAAKMKDEAVINDLREKVLKTQT